MNWTVKSVLGYDVAEVVGKHFVAFVHVDDRELATAAFRIRSQSRVEDPVECRLYCKDGTYKWLAWTAVVDQAYGLVYAVGRDISHRKSLELHVQQRTEELVRINQHLSIEMFTRERAEQALRESEERFRAIYEHSPLGITLVESQGRLVEVNPAFERMLWYSREELIGSDFTAFTDPSSWELQRREHSALMRRDPHYQMEKRYRRKDGTEMLGRWTSTVLEQAGGSLLRLSLVEDISERELAIEELSRVRRDWDDVFDGAPDSVIILDREQRIVTANKATVEAFGLTREQLVGRHCYEIFHGTDRPVEGCPALAALGSQDRVARQVHVGRLGRVFQVSCVPMFDPSGNVDRIIHTAKDVTSSYEATVELRRLKGEWRNVFDSIDYPAMILDPEHWIVAVNAATTRAIGKPDQELLGKRCYEVFHGADEPIYDCPMERALQTRQGERAEVPFEYLRGQFMVSCSPVFDESGKLEKVIHIAIDVTDRVRAEEELRDNQVRLRAVFETLRVQKTGRFE